jgi:tRNA(Ile)-lysidine synthase
MNSFEAAVAAGMGLPGPEGAVFLAAVSGGADSTAMLAALAAIRDREKTGAQGTPFILHCLHVEHGIRPPEESRADARAVQELCGRLDVPCRVVSIAPGKIARIASRSGEGLEAAARRFRRRAWNRERRRIGACRILVAHTGDDRLENLLMGILRGAGPAGLAAMPRERGAVLRPLLDLSRADVLRYLEDRGISFRTDSTNADIRFLRNRVRLKLIPCLDEFFPQWRKGLLGLGETQALAAAFLSGEARRRIPWEPDRGALKTRAEAFFAELEILREEALFLAADLLAAGKPAEASRYAGTLGDGGKYRAPPRRAALRRAVSGALTGAADLGPIRLERGKDHIRVKPSEPDCFDRGFSLLIKAPGSYTLKSSVFSCGLPRGLTFEVSGPVPGYAGIPGGQGFFALFPLVLRAWREGDFISGTGQKRRLSDILKEKRLSGYHGVITAQDSGGCAAFIVAGGGQNVLLLRRNSVKGAAAFVTVSAGSIEISGGIDV